MIWHFPSLFIYANFHSESTMKARFEKGTRYYTLTLQKDLLEDWVVVADNGRINSKLGQRRTLAFTFFIDAFEHFCTQANIRFKRDYQCMSYISCDNFFNYLCLIQVTILQKPQDKLECIKIAPKNAKPMRITKHKNSVAIGNQTDIKTKALINSLQSHSRIERPTQYAFCF